MKKRLLILVLVSLLVSTVRAQNTSAAWEITFYSASEAAIITLTSEGETRRIAVPDKLLQFQSPSVYLSSDNHWLVFEEDLDYGDGTVYIADLTKSDCCTTFGRGFTLPDRTSTNYFDLIGVSPDSKQVAVTTVDASNCGEICFPQPSGWFIDLATMSLNPMGKTLDIASDVKWEQNGIVSTHAVLCMEGDTCVSDFTISSRSVWNPLTGEATSSPIIVWSYAYDRGDHLALTGEYVSGYFYYPQNIQYMYPPAAPALVYYSPDMDTKEWRQSPSPIYRQDWQESSDSTFFMDVHWVLDGNAVLMRTEDDINHAQVIMRDDSQQTVDMPYNQEFLAGTPEGWLTAEVVSDSSTKTYSTTIYNYHIEKGQIKSDTLFVIDKAKTFSKPILLRATPLGTTVTQPFASVPVPVFESQG